jgi:DHA1 family florfenicol/chloramphenicol resistance protein-like MFS transporter
MSNKQQLSLLAVLALYVLSFAFAFDIYVPVITEVTAELHTTPFMVQMTLSLFLVTVTIADFILGPISDQLGRVRMITISVILFILGALGCALAQNITMLIIARIVCALGASGLLMTPFAILRDLFSGNESGKMFSWLNTAIGISPTFAPIIGSYLGFWLGWRSVFFFLVVMGVIISLMTPFVLKETLPIEKRKKIDKYIFRRYWLIMTNAIFIRNALCAGLGMGIFFSFFSSSPFILIGLLHVSVKLFGWYFAAFGVTLIVGSYFSGYFIGRFSTHAAVKLALAFILLGGCTMLLVQYTLGLSILGFLATMVITCFGAIIILSACASQALEPFGEIAGTAAACMQGVQFLVAAIMGSILLHFPVNSSTSYAIAVLIAGTICCWMAYLDQRVSHE